VIRHIPSHILFSYRNCPISVTWSGVAQCCLLTYCSHWSAVCNPWAIRYSFLVFTSSTFSHIRATKCSGRKSAFRLYGYFLIAFCNALCVLVLCNFLFQLKIYMYIIAFNFPLYIVFVLMFFITTKCSNITLTFKGYIDALVTWQAVKCPIYRQSCILFLRSSYDSLPVCLSQIKHGILLYKVSALSLSKLSMDQNYFPVHTSVLITCKNFLSLWT
jgi:hypothetical protein